MGASISLVAGAALSLLVVSLLFSYDGLSGASDESVARAALLVEGQSPAAAPGDGAPRTQAVVIRTAAPSTPSTRSARDVVKRASIVLRSESAAPRTGVTDLDAAPPPASNPAGSGSTGDGVRDLGDSVTTTVGETGDATAPLGPPVSKAVQDALEVVQGLVKHATDGLAGTLDTALPRR